MSGNPNIVPRRTFSRLHKLSDKQLDIVRVEMITEVSGVYKEVRKLAAERNGLAAVEREINRRITGVEL